MLQFEMGPQDMDVLHNEVILIFSYEEIIILL